MNSKISLDEKYVREVYPDYNCREIKNKSHCHSLIELSP